MAKGEKEIRRRIKSVKSTQQITRAMKMVASAKLKKLLADKLAFVLTPDFNVLALDFRMFSDPHRVGGWVWRYRVYRARNDRPEIVGLEALHAVVFGNEC